MEFTVVTASNLPPKPILAVHAGSVWRQMKLEVNHPFVLPNPGEKASVEVSVFQQLASQLLPEDGKVETKCTIPVRRPDGTATQVRLEIRRDGSHEEKDGQCIQTYLEEHKVQQRIQSLIQEVLREAPEDPYKFMLQQLREIQASTPRHVRSEEPLQPHPPDQPKPAGGRPPAPGRVLTQKQVDKSAWKASKHVVRSVLESPRCRYLGEESIQLGVCQKAARGMTKCIMESACQTVVSEASGRKEVRAVAQQVVKATVASASHMVYLQKSGILSKCTIRSVLIGAIQRLGSSDATLDCLDQPLQPHAAVHEAITTLMGSPPTGTAAVTEASSSLTPTKLLDIHKFMLAEYERLALQPDKGCTKASIITFAAQAIVAGKAEAAYQVSVEDIESAVLVHQGALSSSPEFSEINVKMQKAIAKLMGIPSSA